MSTSDFTTTIIVDQTPEEVFSAINDVRGWWSEEIEGATDQLNDEFRYHYKDVHICRMRLIEVIPNKRVVWLVLENYFNFTQDKSEWVGTKIIFDISEKDGKTHMQFTHQGLIPAYECYDICQNAWSNYIHNSLGSLIRTGKGEPNGKETPRTEDEIRLGSMKSEDYKISITVDATPNEAFESINSVTKWWTENLEGNSEKLNDEFTVQFGDVHFSKQKLVEIEPGKKVVWLVTDSKLNFIEDKEEWTGTKVIFEIAEQDGQTQIQFTHEGLRPAIECFDACSNAWGHYIEGSLFKLLTEGKGLPELK